MTKFLAALLVGAVSTHAAMVTNYLTDGFGNPIKTRVVITPYITSTVFGGTNVYGLSVGVACPQGAWNARLLGGFYWVDQGLGQSRIPIFVDPSDTQTNSLAYFASAATNSIPSFISTTTLPLTTWSNIASSVPISGLNLTRNPAKVRSQNIPPMGYYIWYVEPFSPTRPDWADITNMVQMYKTNKLDGLGWKYILFDDTYTSGNWYFSNYWIYSTNFPPIPVVLDYIHTNGVKAGTWVNCAPAAYPGDAAVSNIVYMGFDYVHLDFDYESPNAGYKRAASVIYSNTFNPPIIHAAVDAHNSSNWSPDVFDFAQVIQLLPHGLDQTDTILSYYEFLVTASQARNYLKPGQYLWPCAPLLYPAGSYCSTNYPLAMGISCMMNGPLELGIFDIPGIADPFWKNVVCQPQAHGTTTNRMLLSIDQDPLQIPAFIVWDKDNVICLAKPLTDGRMAVSAFHHVKDEADKSVTINFQDLGMPDSCIVQEVMPQVSWGSMSTSLSTNIPAGQMPIWILTPDDSAARTKQIVGTFNGDGTPLKNLHGRLILNLAPKLYDNNGGSFTAATSPSPVLYPLGGYADLGQHFNLTYSFPVGVSYTNVVIRVMLQSSTVTNTVVSQIYAFTYAPSGTTSTLWSQWVACPPDNIGVVTTGPLTFADDTSPRTISIQIFGDGSFAELTNRLYILGATVIGTE